MALERGNCPQEAGWMIARVVIEMEICLVLAYDMYKMLHNVYYFMSYLDLLTCKKVNKTTEAPKVGFQLSGESYKRSTMVD